MDHWSSSSHHPPGETPVKPLQGLHQGGPCEEAPQVLADVLQRGRPGGWM